MRDSGIWFSAFALRRLRPGPHSSVFVQESRLLPVVWRAAHVRHGGASGGPRDSRRTRPAMGAVVAVRAALPRGVRSGAAGRSAADLPPRRVRFAEAAGAGLRRPAGAVRRGDVYPEVWKRLESESPLPCDRFYVVYAAGDDGAPRFYPLRPPDRRDVLEVAARVAKRVASRVESQSEESQEQNAPSMAAMAGASILGRIAEGPNAGQRVQAAGIDTGEDSVEESFETGRSRCAMASGFSIHAGVGIRAGQRKELERLCKYAARPPLATDRLSRLPDGRLSYRLKTPWRNGTTHVMFEPLELVEKLAVLVPAPRANLIRFHVEH